MSAAGRQRFSARRPVVVVDVGCHCSCRRRKHCSLFSSFRSKLGSENRSYSSSPSSAATTSLWAFTATLSSEGIGRRGWRVKKKAVSAAEEGVPVVKESSEPYADFRESMLQMIVEKELYAWEELDELLHVFLALNSPCHYHLIRRAFADVSGRGYYRPDKYP